MPRVPGAHVCRDARELSRGQSARFANVPGFLCVHHYNRHHHSGWQYRPVVSFIFFPRSPTLPTAVAGYLETVRDLPGSAGGNQRKRRLRVRPLCTHASVSSRTPLAHLSPDNYRISAWNSPARPHGEESPAKSVRHRTG